MRMTLRKTLAASTAALVLILSLASAAPARADHSQWVIGTGFRIGHFNLNIAFRDFDRQHHRPVYYYRVHDRFPYRNFPCNSRCFREGDHYYHDANCPAVERHFDAHRYDRHEVFYRYAPRPRGSYDGDRDDGRYRDRYYDDDDDDDRDDYYDRDRRDRRHRRYTPPRHRHQHYCPYHR